MITNPNPPYLASKPLLPPGTRVWVRLASGVKLGRVVRLWDSSYTVEVTHSCGCLAVAVTARDVWEAVPADLHIIYEVYKHEVTEAYRVGERVMERLIKARVVKHSCGSV
jgi:hypothetical protein